MLNCWSFAVVADASASDVAGGIVCAVVDVTGTGIDVAVYSAIAVPVTADIITINIITVFPDRFKAAALFIDMNMSSVLDAKSPMIHKSTSPQAAEITAHGSDAILPKIMGKS